MTNMGLAIESGFAGLGLHLYALGISDSDSKLNRREDRLNRSALQTVIETRRRVALEGMIGYISDMLSLENAGPQNLREVSVSLGPGGFTGLRVALAFCKGLAVTKEPIRFAQVRSLELLVNEIGRRIPSENRNLCLILPSTKKDAYFVWANKHGNAIVDIELSSMYWTDFQKKWHSFDLEMKENLDVYILDDADKVDRNIFRDVSCKTLSTEKIIQMSLQLQRQNFEHYQVQELSSDAYYLKPSRAEEKKGLHRKVVL